MSSFDRCPGLNTKMSVAAMFSNVLQPAARDELDETFVDFWTPVMPNQLETCGNMRKFAGVLKRWQQLMQQKT
jgi:hypothetical protein